ncbi:hypothetical protein GCM10023189_39750 [Nibrella saemangeumensis]|uniref:Uncharacterized protein n=1 Tax=Nibrella saemangeumensis TaxID=1084526 RepID=A0ABP8N7M6_9BACT
MAVSRAERKKQLAHALAGFIIIAKGVDKIDHHHLTMGYIILLIGVVVLLITIFHHRLARYFRSFDSFVFFAEFVVLAIISGLYFSDGKKALPLAYALASLGYLVGSVLHYRRAGRTTVPH